VGVWVAAVVLAGCAADPDDPPTPTPPVADPSPGPSERHVDTLDTQTTPGEMAATVAETSRAAIETKAQAEAVAADEPTHDATSRSEVHDAEDLGGAETLGWTEEHMAKIDRVQPLVIESCVRRSLDVDLVNAIIWVESKFNPKARGPAGARGLMQIMPSTARGIAKRIDRKSRPYDPEFNLDAGTWLLRRLIDKADGDVTKALVAYNRGWAYVDRHEETGEPWSDGLVHYLEKVERARAAFEHSQFAGADAMESLPETDRVRPQSGPRASPGDGDDLAGSAQATLR